MRLNTVHVVYIYINFCPNRVRTIRVRPNILSGVKIQKKKKGHWNLLRILAFFFLCVCVSECVFNRLYLFDGPLVRNSTQAL